MVTKEKRARLRSMLENQVFEGELKEVEKLFAAIFETPALLDALDEAEAEIVSLKDRIEDTEWWGHVDPAPLKARIVELETEVAALKASTMVVHVDESLRMAMDRESAELKARIAELEAATQWRNMEDAPRDGTAIFAMHRNGRVYQVTYESEGEWDDLDGHSRDTDDFLCWLPIPELVGAAV